MDHRLSYALALTLTLLMVASSSFVGAATPWSGEFSPAMSTSAEQEAHVGQSTAPGFASGRLIVQFCPGVRPISGLAGLPRTGRPATDRILASQQVLGAIPLFPEIAGEGQPDPRGFGQIYVLQLPDGSDVLAAAVALSASPDVAWAEPDYLAQAVNTIPNDPLFTQQWGLARVQAPAAWDVVTGTLSTVIAIVDSGIDMTHPDLDGKRWINPGEIPGNGLDDDNNGLVDDAYGWDFVHETNDPADDSGHGTQVAGVTAAATDNDIGMAGVCWGCRLMAVKVMQGGIANYSDIAQGLVYAARKGAHVINLSLGGYSDSQALHAAVQAAVEQYGAVVVAGAGNDGTSAAFYPAAYPEVVAVAGTDSGDVKWAASNSGAWVDLMAPGVGITTTYMGGDYGPGDGTSFSSAFVSGLAGLVRSQHPEWSGALVRAQMEHTADSIDGLNPGYEGKLGAGRINAGRAVAEVPHPLLAIAGTEVNGDVLGRPAPGEPATLQVTLGNEWLDATGVQGVLSTADPAVTVLTGTATFGSIGSGASGVSSPVYGFTTQAGIGYNHAIPFTLAVTANGGSYAVTLGLTVTTRSAEEVVGGPIFADTIWASDKTYIAESNVAVASGVTLTIEPGTLVLLDEGISLNVEGTLIAEGTAEASIRLLSHTGGNWGRIYFADAAVDATATMSGTYLGGNVLRWVEVEGSMNGIACNGATPFLEHVMMDGGGINCTAGQTPLWLLDSDLSGNVTVGAGGDIPELIGWWTTRTPMPAARAELGVAVAPNGKLYAIGGWGDGGIVASVEEYTPPSMNSVYSVQGTVIHSGDLSMPETSEVLASAVSGNISTGNASVIRNTAAGGSINIDGRGTVVESSARVGISLGAGTAQENEVAGGISIGSGEVLSNTLHGGGISAGDGSRVQGNNVESSSGWGIAASGNTTLVGNRVIGNSSGIQASGGLVQGNLVANSSGVGLEIDGNCTIVSNTLTANAGSAVQIVAATALTITGNNLEFNNGAYDVEVLTGPPELTFPAGGNWWGTTDGNQLNRRIHDHWDNPDLAQLYYMPLESGPVPSAPAYVRAVTVDPDPSGIETAMFDVTFSREMMTDTLPALSFRSVNQGRSWSTYNSSNSGLPGNSVYAVAVAPGGSIWFGTGAGAARFDGTTWAVYSTTNSGLPNNDVHAIAVAPEGSAWFGTGAGAAHFDGMTWTVYSTTNSGLPSDSVSAVAVAPDGSAWFGTAGGGAARFDGTTWTVYNTGNSGLPNNNVYAIAVDPEGSAWFGTWGGGAARFDGTTWAVYNRGNSGLPNDRVLATAVVPDSSVWLGTETGGVARFDGGTWTVYNSRNSGLPGDCVNAVAVAPDGSAWFGSYYSATARFDGTSWTVYNSGNSGLPNDHVFAAAVGLDGSAWFGTEGGGASKFWNYPIQMVQDNPTWLSPSHYRATYDVTALVPRDAYTVRVAGALGRDRLEIVPNSLYTFTVDYAGEVGDTTPPPPPIVTACGAASADTLSARWSAGDPDSAITLYRYAIGTTPGGSDVVNWTNTPDASMLRSGLGLLPGQTYYVAVQARNEGGLWSASGVSSGVAAGAGSCPAANFVADPVTGTVPLAVQFTDISTGTVESWQWELGDGVTSTEANPAHTYAAAGVYTVSLLVSGPGGSDLLVRPNYLTVTPPAAGYRIYLPLVLRGSGR